MGQHLRGGCWGTEGTFGVTTLRVGAVLGDDAWQGVSKVGDTWDGDGAGCSGQGDAQGWGDGPAGGDTSPVLASCSLKRANEEKEQRLALLEDGQAAAEREVTELRASMRELERARLDARRELQDLRRQVRGRKRMGPPPTPIWGVPKLSLSPPRAAEEPGQ